MCDLRQICIGTLSSSQGIEIVRSSQNALLASIETESIVFPYRERMRGLFFVLTR